MNVLLDWFVTTCDMYFWAGNFEPNNDVNLMNKFSLIFYMLATYCYIFFSSIGIKQVFQMDFECSKQRVDFRLLLLFLFALLFLQTKLCTKVRETWNLNKYSFRIWLPWLELALLGSCVGWVREGVKTESYHRHRHRHRRLPERWFKRSKRDHFD